MGLSIDREKVIETLESCVANPLHRKGDKFVISFDVRFVNAIIELLKEQEAVVPYIDIDEAKCPVCKVKLTRQELIGDDVLFEDFFDYCPHCGKPVLWEGR